ncbi:hypothetical protein [Agromyces italicus]|uniref:hypothetical protein n=1 Tax=Agromyces italicus TaxID=279572 RepID=UPI0003B472E3|nr:hypothetical protein [Agromyces italicus]
MSTDDDTDFGADETGALGDEARAALAEIDDLPLAERAPAYDALAARLRDELEQSDPSRVSPR